jgi:AraC-like DNA-binding protein
MEPVLHDIQIMISACLLLLGAIQLMYRNSGPLNRNLAIAFFSLGYILLYLSWLTAKNGHIPGILSNTESAVTFFSGPAIFLSVSTIVGERPNLPARHALHYLVPTTILALNLGYNAACRLMTGSFPRPWDYSIPAGDYLGAQAYCVAGNLWLLAYTAATIANVLLDRRRGTIAFTRQYAFFIAILAYLVLMSAVSFVTSFVNAPELMLAAVYLCGVFVIVFGLLGFRYPEYINRVLKAVSGQKKRREALARLGPDALMDALVAHMERSQAFRNPDLTIDEVAGAIGASAQIVSELVNRKTGANFRAWINAWRVLAACERLARDADASILDIAFESGFNSKSSFNAAFQEIAGKTPRDFRKAMGDAPGTAPEALRQTLKLPSFVKSSVAK